MSLFIQHAMLLDGTQTDVLIRNGLFEAVGPALDREADRCIDATGMAILPTFVNGHTHISMSLLRGYADDLELHEWLTQHIWPQEATLTEEDIYHGARLACLEMIKSGTTTFADMYWHFPGIARAVDEMGLRALLSSVFIDFNDPVKAAEQRELTLKLYDLSKQYPARIGFSLGPHAIYTVSEASLRWVRSFAMEQGLKVHIHLSETEKEVVDCLALHGVRPVEYLERIGFLGPHLLAAHVIHVSDEEIALLASNGVTVVHNPVSNMKLCSGSFPYKRLKMAGVRMALGTDGCSSNNNLDMLEEMKMAALHAKLVHQDPMVLPAEEVFALATVDGAHALGMNGGAIELGRVADCMLVDLSNHRLAPGFHLASDMVYSADASCIDTVICDGRILMEGGRVEGEEEIVAEAKRYVSRFRSAISHRA
jgi:5-methylthioadenosine/S-adenosylhomocysteine deaminase